MSTEVAAVPSIDAAALAAAAESALAWVRERQARGDVDYTSRRVLALVQRKSKVFPSKRDGSPTLYATVLPLVEAYISEGVPSGRIDVLEHLFPTPTEAAYSLETVERLERDTAAVLGPWARAAAKPLAWDDVPWRALQIALEQAVTETGLPAGHGPQS